MSTPPRPEDAVSRVMYDEGQQFLRVARDHAISTAWLEEHTPDLYAEWLATTSPITRDEIAATIDRRFDAIEFPTTPPNLPRRASASPTPSGGPSADDQLLELVEDYETRLIGTGGTRDSLPELRSHIRAHIGWNQLEHSPITVAWQLRDWAEHGAPALLGVWQRDVVAYGGLAGGDEQMARIAAARHARQAETSGEDAGPSPARQVLRPTAEHTAGQPRGPGLRAVEGAATTPLRAVPGGRGETTLARARQSKIAPPARGRPVLQATTPPRAPRR